MGFPLKKERVVVVVVVVVVKEKGEEGDDNEEVRKGVLRLEVETPRDAAAARRPR